MNEPQVVQVDAGTKKLTYLWGGENPPLKVGDWVRVPPNWFKKNPQVLQVVLIGTSGYQGTLAFITEKIECSCGDEGSVFCYYHPNAQES